MKIFRISFLIQIPLLLAALTFTSCQQSSAQSAEATSDPVSAPAAAAGPYQDLDVAGFQKIMAENPDAVILDVRTAPEVAQGAIDGYVHIDIKSPNFQNQIKELDKDKTYLVYCRSGRRSVAACQYMAQEGFSNLYNLQGGYISWARQQPQKRTILNNN
jgi:rhodanese-related sulfurtransferase